MNQLKNLAYKLKENNFEMTKELKDEFKEFLSIIAPNSRIIHNKFGIGTVKRTMGDNWVLVHFDNDKQSPYRTYRRVYITNCISLENLFEKEHLRKIRNDVFNKE